MENYLTVHSFEVDSCLLLSLASQNHLTVDLLLAEVMDSSRVCTSSEIPPPYWIVQGIAAPDVPQTTVKCEKDEKVLTELVSSPFAVCESAGL